MSWGVTEREVDVSRSGAKAVPVPAELQEISEIDALKAEFARLLAQKDSALAKAQGELAEARREAEEGKTATAAKETLEKELEKLKKQQEQSQVAACDVTPEVA